MEPRRIIRTDIAASALAHLTLVGLIILISEVHPFHAAPTETVSVDIVTPEQLKEEVAKEEAKDQAKDQAKDKPPEPPLDLKLPKPDVMENKEAAAQPAKPPPPAPSPSPAPKASPESQKQQPQQPPAQKQREANAQPQAQPQPTPQPPPQAAAPAYVPPAPDVTIKYGVMLGLPPELPAVPKDDAKDDGGAAQDSLAAKLAPETVAEFRRHLRSCTKPPAGVAPTDKVHIKMRVVMGPDGTLAREPILIEASASPAKGLAMLESAKSALLACQPYKMLPADKYQEWQVLDLSFTPKDFGAS